MIKDKEILLGVIPARSGSKGIKNKNMIKILGRGPLARENREKFQRYLELMGDETGRCSEIVSNLLAFSRKSKLEFRQIDIHELLQKCIMLSQHKLALQNIRLKTDLAKDVPVVSGDFNQIQQCIINLMFNAIDAMIPHGGTLTLGVSINSGRDMVEISIGDTGQGISNEDLTHIFDPFYTTKMEGKGIGLGLSTVYGVIDRHSGAINVESEPGKGSVFTVILPLAVRRNYSTKTTPL